MKKFLFFPKKWHLSGAVSFLNRTRTVQRGTLGAILWSGLVLAMVQTQPLQKDTLEKIANRVLQMDQWRQGKWQAATENGRWKYTTTVTWLLGFLGGELWNMAD